MSVDIINICKQTQEELLEYLPKELEKYYGKKLILKSPDFIYAYGSLPVTVVAHLDTVHKYPVDRVFKTIDEPVLLTSFEGIGGDDRCGVYIILKLLEKGFRPSVLFTTEEEVGGIGARKFCDLFEEGEMQLITDSTNFFLEFDRRGATDVVRYNDDNDALIKEIEKFGFKEAFGSFTDISTLCPHFKISGVNLSSGYYNAHTTEEYINLTEVEEIIEKATNILSDEVLINTKFEYKETPYRYYPRISGYSWYDNLYDRYGDGWYDKPRCSEKKNNDDVWSDIEGRFIPLDVAIYSEELDDYFSEDYIDYCNYCGGDTFFIDLKRIGSFCLCPSCYSHYAEEEDDRI